ncbi:uncharacterized protein UHOD_11292 [Ustilago sp. UG-2017b]|nr:uncharacterized protein UHOD_11292 [Ustilago sp. UG-2017b]
MTDQDLNSKLDRLLALMEAQLELSRQSQREERLGRAHLSGEETIEPSHSEDQDHAGGGDESTLGDPNTPTPAPRPRRSVSFNLNEYTETNYEKYASPTGPKYLKTRVDPYSRSRMDFYVQEQEQEASIMAERSKPVATPFPKMEAYNKLLALRLTSDAPGAATRHVEQFRDLEGQVNLGDNELTIDLFRGSLTRSIQEKFERNPPKELWEWFQEVEEIDRQRMLLQQASARHSQANNASLPGTHPIQSHGRHFEEITDSGDSHSGNTEPVQEDMDLSPYQQHMDSNHEEEQGDDDEEGNVSGAMH